MRRARLLSVIAWAAFNVLALASIAQADPTDPFPPCPSRGPTRIGPFHLGRNSESQRFLLDVKPCEAVVVTLEGSASSHPSGNANMQLIIRNSEDVGLATTNFLCGQSCTTTAPLAGTVPGYPMPGTLGDREENGQILGGGHPHNVIVRVGNFNFFGTPPAEIRLTVTRTPRPGYNTAGNSFANALPVTLPATQLGSVHPRDTGQFVKLRLQAFESLYASGHVKGHPQYGAYWEIEVYDANLVAIKDLIFGTAYGGPHLYNSKAFTNAAAEPRDFYVRFWCRFWPVYEWSMNLVAQPSTTRIMEVGFANDHKITRWRDKFPIDPNDKAPTWIRGRGGNQTENFPASYTKDVKPTLFGLVSIRPAFTSATTVKIRAKHGSTVVTEEKQFVWDGEAGRIDALQITAVLEDSTGVVDKEYEFTWEMSRDGGTMWLPIGESGDHRVYWTFAPPIFRPFTNYARSEDPVFDPTYDRALKEATDAANKSVDIAEIKLRVNRRLGARLWYEPSDRPRFHPLEAHERGQGQCGDFAQLLRGMLRSIGIDEEAHYVVGGGPGSGGEVPYWYRGPRLKVYSLQVERPPNDGAADSNPHFTFHAVAGTIAGLVYDPAYGIERTGPNPGVIETLDAVNGNVVTQASQVKLSWSLFSPPEPPQTANKSCTHVSAGPFAGFVDQSLPDTMTATQSYPVTVTFRNAGDDTWTTGDGVSLVPADAETAAAFGAVNVAMPTAVLPDEEVVFTFLLTAPSTPGSYTARFGLQKNAAGFGAKSAQVAVTVQ